MPSGDSDNVYSIGVSNKFDMIDSDMFDDPSELIRAAQEKPKKEKEPKVKGKKDVKPVKTAEKKSVKTETNAENENSENRRNDRPRNERGRGRGRGRGGRGGERGDRGGRGRGGFRNNNYSPNNNNQGGFGFDNNNQGGFGSYQTQVAETNEGGFGSGFGGNDGEERRGGRSGFRGGRGGRGGRGRGRGGNREFDRRSGSDKSSVKPADKRDGSGSYNWGSPQDEINAASEENGGFGAPPKETEETPAENVEQTPETEETPEVEPVDEGPQEMTFEEYRKQQSEARKQPEFNLRKVDSDKKGLKQLKKPTVKDNESSSAFFFPKKNIQEVYKTSGRVKESLNVDIRYGSGDNRHYDASRRGRGRGGRRGGRRDGEGNAKGAGYALTNDDEFPSL